MKSTRRVGRLNETKAEAETNQKRASHPDLPNLVLPPIDIHRPAAYLNKLRASFGSSRNHNSQQERRLTLHNKTEGICDESDLFHANANAAHYLPSYATVPPTWRERI